MPKSFLPQNVLNSFDVIGTPSCSRCGLYRDCKSPKMKVTGLGWKKVLVIAECPGAFENEKGTQLIGRAGKRLRETLRDIGVDLDVDCWKTNCVICFPGNRNPTQKEIDYCLPNVKKTIKELQPETIIVLGSASVSSVIGWLWKSKPGGITRWAGWKIPSQQLNAWVCPTYHPSYIMRKQEEVLDVIFEKHLREAFELKGRPWKKVPDYAKDVEIVLNTAKAARIIDKMVEKGGRASWDLETTTLKPDGPESEIVCCSVCWEGKKTIAFPWEGVVTEAMRFFLVSKVKKIAANMKFEHRYVMAREGLEVENWDFDTMQAAHILDNRKGITGLKFQAFARLGQPAYDEHTTPYLKSSNSNKANSVKRMDTRELLLYCGMDSLLEFKLAEIQRKEMGYE